MTQSFSEMAILYFINMLAKVLLSLRISPHITQMLLIRIATIAILYAGEPTSSRASTTLWSAPFLNIQ
jgi:hypothetical protein